MKARQTSRTNNETCSVGRRKKRQVSGESAAMVSEESYEPSDRQGPRGAEGSGALRNRSFLLKRVGLGLNFLLDAFGVFAALYFVCCFVSQLLRMAGTSPEKSEGDATAGVDSPTVRVDTAERGPAAVLSMDWG